MKKILSLVLALCLVLASCAVAFAAGEPATITIDNASRGESYSVFKIFDATVSTATVDGESQSIAYTYSGTLPEKLAEVFTKIEGTDYVVRIDGKTNDQISKAVAEYAATLTTPDYGPTEATGGPLTFNVAYGYYAIKSTQNADKEGGNVISVDSTHPNANVKDKNETVPTADKVVDQHEYNIGDTLTYTLTFNTSNFKGNDKVVSYTITDTLPDFLDQVTVTSVTIGGVDYKVGDPAAYPQFVNKAITIPWVDTTAAKNSLYANGADIVITYTAVLKDSALTVDGNGNTNKVTLTRATEEEGPTQEHWDDEETVYTYAAALQKVDENKKPLAGATFAAYGLQATGSAGEYTVVTYTAGTTTLGTTMETDAQGQLVIRGLSTANPLTVYEVAAPNGYNKLINSVTMTPVKIDEEVKKSSGTIYYDANGKVTNEVTETSYEKNTFNVPLLKTAVVVVNNRGAELPSTGGMGTTIFYILGGLLVVGAAVILIARRKAQD